jgi:hypothetical protein
MSTQLEERFVATRVRVCFVAQTRSDGETLGTTMQFMQGVCVLVCVANSSLTHPTTPPFVLPRAGSMLKRNINSPAGLCFVSPLATSHACSSNPSVHATGVCHPQPDEPGVPKHTTR